jgi:hypothetical protein
MRGYMFVDLLVSDEVLAILEAFNLELVTLGPGVDVLDVVCGILLAREKESSNLMCLPVVVSKWLDAS